MVRDYKERMLEDIRGPSNPVLHNGIGIAYVDVLSTPGQWRWLVAKGAHTVECA